MANVTKIKATPKPLTMKEAEKRNLKVAAYARVSTDHEDQQTSLAAQTDYYWQMINSHPGWEMVKIYADEGISGLSAKSRPAFQEMMEACEKGEIDLILTKSISRFARNTVDSITAIRKLKERGIGVFFEKENIYSLDSKGEFILTLMSSLAQEESRSISENVAWGHRKRFADGKSSLAYSRFLGYDRGPNKYEMVINEEQAVIVRRIFYLFLVGYAPATIAKIMEKEGCIAPAGGDRWNPQTVRRMLENEKYKGDALLQKEFTVDFLRKKSKKNEGELPQYYVENDHEAIISRELFDYVQEEIKNRLDFKAGRYSGVAPFTSKLLCGKCGEKFGAKQLHSNSRYKKTVWMCNGRYGHGRGSENRCMIHCIYDEGLTRIVYWAAWKLFIRRKIKKVVIAILSEILPEERMEDVEKALVKLRDMPAQRLLRDDDDMAIFMRQLIVMPEGTVEITLIDGSTITYILNDEDGTIHKEVLG